MRVAFITNVVYPFVTGGAEKRVHEIGTRLAAGGHDVTVYGRHYWDGPREMIHRGMTLRAVAPAADLYRADGRRSIPEAVGFSARLVPTLGRRVDEHDVVVASVFPYFPVLSTKLCTLLDGTPLVTTWHEVWGDYWEDYLGHLAHFGKTVERVTARLPQHPVAVSGTTADRLAEIGPRRDRISVVPNGINLDHLRSVRPAEEGFDVLFAGRLIEDKQVDRLIRAFDAVATDHDVSLGIVGDGPHRCALERVAGACESRDRITFLGFLEDYDDVLAHMKAARIFASPSTREGFGIAYLEAMAADCFVIGADHPDSAAAEIVDGGGLVVEPTVDALTAGIGRALDGETPPKDPSTVASQYDWDVVSERAEERYCQVIDSG